MNEKNLPTQQTQGLGAVFSSVIAAMLGVQSNKKREEDFTRGRASHYIIAGIIATLLFVLTLLGVVQLVLHITGV